MMRNTPLWENQVTFYYDLMTCISLSFGWYVMGQFTGQEDQSSGINSVDVGTVSALEDMKKL